MSKRLPMPPGEPNRVWATRLVETLERRLDEIERIAQEGYLPSNVTTTRTFDADATSLDELADVLGTLIEDFTQRGWLGK